MSGDIHRKHNRIEDVKPPKTFETDVRTLKPYDDETKIEADKVEDENKSVSETHLLMDLIRL